LSRLTIRLRRTVGRTLKATSALLVLAGALATAACTPAPPEPQTTGTVEQVIDGDTIRLTNGARIRLLAVDAPEFGQRSSTDDECGSREAAQGLIQRLPKGAAVGLVRDTGQPDVDRYGRQLRYMLARLDGSGWRDVGLDLTEAGLAVVYEQYPTSRTPEYRNAQERAKAAQRGLWRTRNEGGCWVADRSMVKGTT
jgi:micrococcal nuclease